MRKIIKYEIVSENDIEERLDEGWQPYGSPFYMPENKDLGLGEMNMQAMVKYQD